jgi:eukaryotic translation initiation factor 2C
VAGPAAMEVSAPQILPMVRPANSHGTKGRRSKLLANFFNVAVKNLPEIYQYDVAIVRDSTDVAPVQPVIVNRNIFRRFTEASAGAYASRIAYDGRKIAYAPVELPAALCQGEFVMKVDRDGNGPVSGAPDTRYEQVVLHIKHSATLDTALAISSKANLNTSAVQPVINALDVALAQGNTVRFVEVGRTFYTGEKSLPLGGGVRAWRGFYQSIRMTEGGLAVNVDQSFTPFWEEVSLMKLCESAAGGRLPPAGNTGAWRALGKDLHSLRVTAPHTGISYRVFGFSSLPANQIFFKDKDGVRTSVAAYMYSAYNYRVTQPNLPCVKTNPKRETYVPIEMLEVCKRQRRSKAMTPNQTSAMIRAAALIPDERKKHAESSITNANYNADQTCKDFGISVNPGLVEVDSRILSTPTLGYGNRRTLEARGGAWNMAREKVIDGAVVRRWMVICVGGGHGMPNKSQCETFVTTVVRLGAENGVSFIVPQPMIHTVPDNQQLEQALRTTMTAENTRLMNIPACRPRDAKDNGLKLNFVLVIKMKQDSFVYNTVKKVCDITEGVASQCVLWDKIKKQTGNKIDQYVSNVLLKINTKCGGQNNKVLPYTMQSGMENAKFENESYIVLGADVTHPSPGPNSSCSVAAVVGSLTSDPAAQYSGSLRNQPARQEIITDIGAMFTEVYRRWYAKMNERVKTGNAKAIIMFRDGVSEGQYQEVLDVELTAIRTAVAHIHEQTMKALGQPFQPKITFVIVTKRHHARFFAGPRTGKMDVDTKKKNLMPGTVIDSGIVSSEQWDFYLCSHGGLQGTSRPSKYTVLYDENKMSADQLQGYIFRLSHGFARCTRSVSLVNAAYYAHLLAFRGRVYLAEGESDGGSVASGNSEAIVPSSPIVNPGVGSKLFFV